MKLKTKFSGYSEVNSLVEVMANLSLLGWTEDDDDFMICEDDTGGVVQVAKYRPGQYIIEWCDGTDPTHLQCGFWRAQQQPSRGERVEVGHKEDGQFDLFESDLLPLSDALTILTSFWQSGDWPRHLYWRNMVPEFKESIRLNDEKHGRMSLCE